MTKFFELGWEEYLVVPPLFTSLVEKNCVPAGTVCVSVSLRFDQESSPENRLYLDCFCVVARGIGVSHDYITMVMLVSLGTCGWSM